MRWKTDFLAFALAAGLLLSGLPGAAQENTITAGGTSYSVGPGGSGTTFGTDKLIQLVAPIALYPDVLLTQILIASTYPVQVVQAYQWLKQNPGVAPAAAQEAVAPLGWDPSVQSLVQFPDILNRMFQNLEWTQDLGEAFLAQKPEVMGTIQAMRQKAQQAGNLQSSPQETVTQQGPEIVIQPADPEVIYVPAYDPESVYGDWEPEEWYYPTAVYAPWPGWYPGVGALAFTRGVAVGAAWSNAWRCDWRGGDIYVNNNYYRGYYGSGSYRGPNGAAGHYGNTTAAYNRNTGEVRSYNAATGNARSGQVTQGPYGTRVAGQSGAVGHVGDTTAAYNRNTGEVRTYNSATGNVRSGDLDNMSNWQHDTSQRAGQSYSNESLNRQYGGGDYGTAERGYGDSGGVADLSSGGFEGLGGGGFEQSASDRGWSSRGGGSGGGSVNRGGGFSGGGGGISRGGGGGRRR